MSTSAQVRTAWNTGVLQHASMQAITNKIHLFEVIDDSEKSLELCRYNQEINFAQCLIARGQNYAESSQPAGTSVQYNYQVEITYIREANPSGSNWTATVDFFDTLQALVVTQLGVTWSSTVDYHRPQDGTPAIESVTFDNVLCWRGTYRFAATKYTSL